MTDKDFEKQIENSYLVRWANSDGDDILRAGVHELGQQFLRFVSERRPDLPILLTCVETSLPHLKRHMTETEADVYKWLRECVGAIDLSGLVGDRE